MGTKINSLVGTLLVNKTISKMDLSSKKRYKHFKFTNIYWNDVNNYIKFNSKTNIFEWKDKEPVNWGMLNFEGYFAINNNQKLIRL
jgi:ADP-dependent phosphofructokinase/glucokinase